MYNVGFRIETRRENRSLQKPDRRQHPNFVLLHERLQLLGRFSTKAADVEQTRQGVRWRFQRLFNTVYRKAFLVILFIEKTFGTQLRDYAVRISRERYSRRQEVLQATS